MGKNKYLETLMKESSTLVEEVNNNVVLYNKAIEKSSEFKTKSMHKALEKAMEDIFNLSTKLLEVNYFCKIYSEEDNDSHQAHQELG